jgi:hypothetical protein
LLEHNKLIDPFSVHSVHTPAPGEKRARLEKYCCPTIVPATRALLPPLIPPTLFAKQATPTNTTYTLLSSLLYEKRHTPHTLLLEVSYPCTCTHSSHYSHWGSWLRWPSLFPPPLTQPVPKQTFNYPPPTGKRHIPLPSSPLIGLPHPHTCTRSAHEALHILILYMKPRARGEIYTSTQRQTRLEGTDPSSSHFAGATHQTLL